MEITISRYDELIKVEEQKNILIREMKARAKDGTDWMSFEALKTIFNLWDIVPEVIRSDDNSGSDTDV